MNFLGTLEEGRGWWSGRGVMAEAGDEGERAPRTVRGKRDTGDTRETGPLGGGGREMNRHSAIVRVRVKCHVAFLIDVSYLLMK